MLCDWLFHLHTLQAFGQDSDKERLELQGHTLSTLIYFNFTLALHTYNTDILVDTIICILYFRTAPTDTIPVKPCLKEGLASLPSMHQDLPENSGE